MMIYSCWLAPSIQEIVTTHVEDHAEQQTRRHQECKQEQPSCSERHRDGSDVEIVL